MAKEEKKQEVASTSSSIFEAFLQNSEDHYSFIKPLNKVFSTGSLILDSIVKVRTGSVVRLVGKGFELGKTSEALVLLDNYMKALPKSKGIYIKAEARLTPEMMARSGMKWVTETKDWVYGTVLIFPCNVFETCAEALETMLKVMHDQGEHLGIVLDSIDGLILRDDLKNKRIDGNAKVAGVPKLTKEMFRRIALPINYYDAFMAMTSQYSAEIKLDQYSKEPPKQIESVGGSSAGHQSDYIFSYGIRFAGDNILEFPDLKPDLYKNKTLGVYATVEIKKGATDISGTRVKIPIIKGRIGSAIWVEKEIVDMIMGLGYVIKSGSWLAFDDTIVQEAKALKLELKEKVQGMNQLYEYLEANKPIFEFFLKKVKAKIG